LKRRKPKLPRRSATKVDGIKSQVQRIQLADETDTLSSPYADNQSSIQDEETDDNQSHIIDILKDRQVYEEVQRSGTNEINMVWSKTFLTFFVVEVVLIGSFIVFGLSMFVLLQCRPKEPDKHVSMFE